MTVRTRRVTYEDALAALDGREVRDGSAQARCPLPSHGRGKGDRTPSLTLDRDDAAGGFVVCCHGGCDQRELFRAVIDLAGNGSGPALKRRMEHVAHYDYLPAPGVDEPVLRKVRLEDGQGNKDFYWKRLIDGRWVNRAGGFKRLYRLPDLIESLAAGQRVLVVEGEKDADTLNARGLVATSPPDGGSKGAVGRKWRAPWNEYLRGADVALIADADDAGRHLMNHVADQLAGVAATVRVLELPRPDGSAAPQKYDVSDWFRDGGTTDQLAALIEQTPAGGRLAIADPLPSAPAARVSVGAAGAADDDAGEPHTKRESQADRLVRLALAAGAELWHDADGVAYMTLPQDERREHHRLRTKAVRAWLAHRMYAAEVKAPGGDALQSALAVLEGMAVYDGDEHTAAVRVAGDDHGIWLDLGRPDWSAVRVTADGWQVVAQPSVRFIRSRGLAPLPVPERGGDLGRLWDFLNVSEDDRALVLAFLAAALRPTGPYAVLIFSGEQGSAKSTATRIARALVDPNTAALRTRPRDERDLAIACANGHVLALDNLSGLAAWLSDALCRVATGAAFATRKLHTDGEEALFCFQKPVIVNGITAPADRPDLLDRAMQVELLPIGEAERRTEREMYDAFAAEHPRLLGCLLDAVACALRRLPSVELDRKPRMADFAMWAEAASPALGLAPGAVLDRFDQQRDDALANAVEAFATGPLLLSLLDGAGGFTGTAGELLAALDDLRGDRRIRGWPSTPKAMGDELRRMAPALRAVGWHHRYQRTGNRREHHLSEQEGD